MQDRCPRQGWALMLPDPGPCCGHTLSSTEVGPLAPHSPAGPVWKPCAGLAPGFARRAGGEHLGTALQTPLLPARCHRRRASWGPNPGWGQHLPHGCRGEATLPRPPRRPPPHLSVQACCHGHNVPCLAVDGEHVLGRALRGLGHNPVPHHPVGCGAVVRIIGRDGHHIGAWDRESISDGNDLVCRLQPPRTPPGQTSPANPISLETEGTAHPSHIPHLLRQG